MVLCTANIGGYTFVVGYCSSLDSMKKLSLPRLCSCFAKARKVDKPHHVTSRTWEETEVPFITQGCLKRVRPAIHLQIHWPETIYCSPSSCKSKDSISQSDSIIMLQDIPRCTPGSKYLQKMIQQVKFSQHSLAALETHRVQEACHLSFSGHSGPRDLIWFKLFWRCNGLPHQFFCQSHLQSKNKKSMVNHGLTLAKRQQTKTATSMRWEVHIGG